MTPYDIQRAASWRRQSTRKPNPWFHFLVTLPYLLPPLALFLSATLLARALRSVPYPFPACPPQSTSSLL
jgi:hypothetical protein